ncbi:MAG TPA: DivIVA domain-containing protein, partial [Acidimicrobiales bacterium]
MAITPDEIERRVFTLVRRGYDPAEVDDFLKEAAAALAQAQLGVTPPAANEAPTDVAATEAPGAL